MDGILEHDSRLIPGAIAFVRRLHAGEQEFLVTNPNLGAPPSKGFTPACRALGAPVELAIGRKFHFVG
jgi:ribonucleotide monophosphatase NagD (HAD superfamily)